MGRALFSETYGSKAPAIRVQPESIPSDPARWSVHNPFDPDSDDFFLGAEYEAFMDVGEVDRLEHPVVVSDSSSDSSDSGRDSPLEDTSQLQAVWGQPVDQSSAGATYQPVVDELTGEVLYARTLPSTDTDDAITIRATAEPERVRPVVVIGGSVLHPSSLRNSTTATDLERDNAVAAAGALSPRRASVPPITIPVAPSTSSPTSPSSASPTTPPAVYSTHMQLMTPTPPPTVSPRIYVWGTRTPTSPGSPSVRHTYSYSAGGPLTNPSARQSLTRITPRRRAQNVEPMSALLAP
ncbi:hypothetical protein B0H12DRAFT_534197 [Mycena haematopus]|nr:hypothetical protein B0H12DRAFT_534197 [Mycena haematopus]